MGHHIVCAMYCIAM